MAKSPPKVKEITLPFRGYRVQPDIRGNPDILEVYCQKEPVHGKTGKEALEFFYSEKDSTYKGIFIAACYLSAWGGFIAGGQGAGFIVGAIPLGILGICYWLGIPEYITSKTNGISGN